MALDTAVSSAMNHNGRHTCQITATVTGSTLTDPHMYTAGECDCQKDYTGADCSVAANQPPYTSEMPHYGLCDVRYMNCSRVMVYGTNFVNGENLTCLLKRCEVCRKLSQILTLKANLAIKSKLVT